MASRQVARHVRSNILDCVRVKPFPLRSIRTQSTTNRPPQVDIDALLKESSWSVRETLFRDDPTKAAPPVTREELHHLLRLSALPMPESLEQEARMIKDLQAQLKFVQAIQEVDTEGVEPLQMIRDETDEAAMENTITMDTLKEEFAKEEVVGKRGRIRKKAAEEGQQPESKEKWNPLAHASKTHGPYFVVDTAKD